MSDDLKWWRAKTSAGIEHTTTEWFDSTMPYPGREIARRNPMGKFVRLFRDLDAYKKKNSSLAIEVPLVLLDEAETPK
jgi:hypothetical protein